MVKLTLNKSLSLRIACDGESSSGKSTAAKLISKKYNLFCMNSGLLFRYASSLVIKNANHDGENNITMKGDGCIELNVTNATKK